MFRFKSLTQKTIVIISLCLVLFSIASIVFLVHIESVYVTEQTYGDVGLSAQTEASQNIISDHIAIFRSKLIVLFLSVTLFTLLLVFLVLKYSIKPITHISRNLVALSQDGTTRAKAMKVSGTGEVAILGKSYNQLINSINEKERLARELKDTEQNFKNLFEQAVDAMLLLSPQTGEFIDCNAAGLSMFGVERKDQIIGKTPLDFSPEKQNNGLVSANVAFEKINKANQEGRQIFEFNHTDFSGHPFVAYISLSRVTYNGEPVILANLKDISDEKKQAYALRNSQERIQKIFESSPILMILVDEHGLIKQINRAVASFLGLEENMLIGKAPGEVLSCGIYEGGQEDCGKNIDCQWCNVRQLINETLTTKQDVSQREAQIYSKRIEGGKSINLLVYTTFLCDENETPMVLLSLQDVTVQKEQEQELKKVNYLSNTALDLSKSASWYIDVANYPDRFFPSKGLLKITGVELPDDIDFIPFSSWSKERIDTNATTGNNLLLALKACMAGELLTPDVSYQAQRKNDGAVIWLRTLGQAILNEQGNVSIIYGVTQDITDQKRQEDELLKANAMSKNALSIAKSSTWYIDYSNPDYYIASEENVKVQGLLPVKDNAYHIANDWYNTLLAANEELANKAFENYQNAVKGIEDFDATYQLKRQVDGEVVWLRAKGLIIKDKDGNNQFMYGVTQDITDIKQQEQKIRESETRLQQVIDTGRIGSYELHLSDNTTEISDLLYEILGISTDSDNMFEDYVANLHPEDINDVLGSIQKTKEDNSRDTIKIEYRYLHPEKGEIWLMTHARIIDRNADGSGGREIGFMQDITEQKTQELEREKLLSLQKNANELARMGSWYIDCTQEPLFIYMDDNLMNIEGIVGRKQTTFEEWIDTVASTSSEGALVVENALKGISDPNVFSWDEVYQSTREVDGKVIWLRAKAMIRRDDSGKALTIYGSTQDITDQKEREAEREKLLTQQKIANEQAQMGSWYIDYAEEPLFIHRDENLIKIEGNINNSFDSWAKNVSTTNIDGSNIVEKAQKHMLDPTVFEWDETYQITREIDSAVIWLHAKAIIHRDEKGQPVMIYGSSQDITKQKIVELEILEYSEELDKQKTLVESLLMSIPDVVFAKDVDGKYILGNQPFANITNTTADDVVGKTDYDMFPTDVADFFRKMDHIMIEKDMPNTNEETVTNNDGEEIILETTKTPFKDNNGHLLGIIGVARDITVRKMQQAQIEEDRKSLEALFENMPTGFASYEFIWDKDGNPIDYRFIDINPAFTQQTGVGTEVLGKTIREIMPNIEEVWIQKLGKVASTGKATSFEQYNEGTQKHYKTNAFSNRYGHCAILIEDVTKQKQAKQDIIKAKDQAETALNIANSGAWYIDFVNYPDRVFLDDNLIRIQGELFDGDAGYCLITEWVESILKSNTESGRLFVQALGDAIKNPSNFSFEEVFEYVRPLDGKTVWLRIKGKAQRDKDGKPLYVDGVTQDITKQKKSEEELIRSKKTIQNILESAPIAVAIIDLETSKILFSNEALIRVFALDKNKLKDYNAYDIWLDQKDREEAHRQLQDRNAYSGECKIKRLGNDEEFWVAQSGIIFDYDGQPAILTTVVDTTEQKNLQFNLEQAKDDAEAANVAKSAFLANMSHEIRTPMNAIIGFSEILHKKILDPVHKDYIESIRTSGRSLLGLINDVLDFSKIEAGKFELNIAPANLSNSVDEVANMFKIRAEEKGLKIYSSVSESMPKVLMIDELRLKQVLINLVGNALKFTEKGHISIDVLHTEVSDNTHDVLVKVSDTGIGISKDEHVKIFDAFKQQDQQDNRKFGGTGLGLSISNNLIKLMGSQIELESEKGHGSTFFFKLKGLKVADARMIEDDDYLKSSDVMFKDPTVLIIDDIEHNRRVITELFSNKGILFIEATNGEEGVKMAIEHEPDLIFMDIRMPMMSGFEALDRIRHTASISETTIIALTASASKDEVDQVKDHGFDGYLPKPMEEKAVLKHLMLYLPYSIDSKSLENQHENIRTVIKQVLSHEDNSQLLKVPFQDYLARRSNRHLISFAQAVVLLGKQIGNSDLSDLGDELIVASKSFDVERIEKITNIFSDEFKEE